MSVGFKDHKSEIPEDKWAKNSLGLSLKLLFLRIREIRRTIWVKRAWSGSGSCDLAVELIDPSLDTRRSAPCQHPPANDVLEKIN